MRTGRGRRSCSGADGLHRRPWVRALSARHPLGTLTESQADALSNRFTAFEQDWPRGRVAPGDSAERTAAMPTDAEGSGTVSIRVTCRVVGTGALGPEAMVVIACDGGGPVSHRYTAAAATMEAETRVATWSAVSIATGETRRSTSQIALVGRLIRDDRQGPHAVSMRSRMTMTVD